MSHTKIIGLKQSGGGDNTLSITTDANRVQVTIDGKTYEGKRSVEFVNGTVMIDGAPFEESNTKPQTGFRAWLKRTLGI